MVVNAYLLAKRSALESIASKLAPTPNCPARFFASNTSLIPGEHRFLEAGVPASLTDWRDPQREDLRRALAEPMLERAIGVIYRPESERSSHYFEAVLAEQFDAMVWIEQTQPVMALPLPKSQAPEPEDETFPFGL